MIDRYTVIFSFIGYADGVYGYVCAMREDGYGTFYLTQKDQWVSQIECNVHHSPFQNPSHYHWLRWNEIGSECLRKRDWMGIESSRKTDWIHGENIQIINIHRLHWLYVHCFTSPNSHGKHCIYRIVHSITHNREEKGREEKGIN